MKSLPCAEESWSCAAEERYLGVQEARVDEVDFSSVGDLKQRCRVGGTLPIESVVGGQLGPAGSIHLSPKRPDVITSV
jgi:hypothetical protein